MQEKEHSRIVLKKLWPCIRFLMRCVGEGSMERKEMGKNRKQKCKSSLARAYIRKLFNIDY